MRRILIAGLTGALLLVGTMAGPAVPAERRQVDLVSGIGSLLQRAPGPHAARTAGIAGEFGYTDDRGHVTNPFFDGGSGSTPFVLSCPSPVQPALEQLRIRWSDPGGGHEFLITEVTLATCTETDGGGTYQGTALGLCDGLPAAISLSLSKEGGTQGGSVLITGGCQLSTDGTSPVGGEFAGCLSLGVDPTACSGGGGGGLDGWMTGSGTFGDGIARASHALRLECNNLSRNTLTVQWDGGTFELGAVDAASCSETRGSDGSFDTITGSGTGTCNGETVAARWYFDDAGEAGRFDVASISIDAGDGCPGLDSGGVLTSGNQQAHSR